MASPALDLRLRPIGSSHPATVIQCGWGKQRDEQPAERKPQTRQHQTERQFCSAFNGIRGHVPTGKIAETNRNHRGKEHV